MTDWDFHVVAMLLFFWFICLAFFEGEILMQNMVSCLALIIMLQRKSHLCIPRKGIARPQSQFPHPHIFLPQNRQTDLGNIQITHRHMIVDCGNLYWGRGIPFLGIFVSNYRYCVFAVWSRRLQSLICKAAKLIIQKTWHKSWQLQQYDEHW